MQLNKLTVVLILQLFVIHGRQSAEGIAYVKCNNTGEILKPPQNIITVQGESIQFNCSVQGDVADTAPDKDLESYWGVIFPPTKRHYIYYNDTYPFFIAKYQTCLTDNGSCCNFLSRLTIQNVSLEYNATTINCIQYLKDEEINRERNATLTVFTIPKIINSTASEVCATLNESIKIYCTFNASTVDGATIVVWLKDHSVISGYDNETRPVEDNVMLSILNIESVTHEDQGEYTCYCYYNQNMVTSDNLVISDQATVNVHIDCASGKENTIPQKWVIIISGVVILALFLSIICVKIYMKRKGSSNRTDNVTSPTPTGHIVANQNADGPTRLAAVNRTTPVHIPIDCSHHHNSSSVDTTAPVQVAKTPLTQTDYRKQAYGASNIIHHEISNQKYTHSTNSDSLHTQCGPDTQPLLPPSLSANNPPAGESEVSQTSKPDESIKTKPSVVEQQTANLANSAASSTERVPVEVSDGSSNQKKASAAQPGNALPQEIHHHYNKTVLNLLQIKSLSLESAQHKPEQLSLDAANPLHHHAADFKSLVDIKVLAFVLFQNELLTPQDMEHLQLTTIIESEKVDRVYLKMVCLGEGDYKKFLSCLKDPFASQHNGHVKLYDILSTLQQ